MQSLQGTPSTFNITIHQKICESIAEMKALATRVPCIELIVTDDEIAALMRTVAQQGYQHGDARLAPAECLEVANFIIAQSAGLNRPLDMRVLVNAFADRLQSEDHDAGCEWKDLVASTLLGTPSIEREVRAVGIRQQQKSCELEVAREILSFDRADRFRIWAQRGRTTPGQRASWRNGPTVGRGSDVGPRGRRARRIPARPRNRQKLSLPPPASNKLL